jgi:hypothetical protein
MKASAWTGTTLSLLLGLLAASTWRSERFDELLSYQAPDGSLRTGIPAYGEAEPVPIPEPLWSLARPGDRVTALRTGFAGWVVHDVRLRRDEAVVHRWRDLPVPVGILAAAVCALPLLLGLSLGAWAGLPKRATG